ncbi:MAG: preprotein translocase subunit SecY, partial [Firmicutes bacterium]|nr:preprotein translocase subunit SecY [Bacillota bacterium]
GLFGLFDLFSGGSFSNFTIFALSITPYITASIILQLLTVAIPKLEELAKQGQEGQRKIAQWTRYLTVVLALVQAIGYTFGLFRNVLSDNSIFAKIVIVLTLVAGTAFLMWLGERINENGIGNGISLIIFAGIVSRIPTSISRTIKGLSAGTVSIVSVIIFLIFALAVIMGIVMVQEGNRKIPVQYAKRVVGRKMYGGQSTHIPLKVNQAGVIPVIFAISLLQIPATIAYMTGNDNGFSRFVAKYLSTTGTPGIWIYLVLDILLIIFFTYFYGSITVNPLEIADNMKANGGFIPGIRPGKPTSDYIGKVLSRLNFSSAIFLAIIAAIPIIIGHFTSFSSSFGGTSLIIAVGVALDTMKALETQMVMRNYSGFLK